MRKQIALGILGLFLLAGLVPTVLADDDDDEREERDKDRDEGREHREHRFDAHDDDENETDDDDDQGEDEDDDADEGRHPKHHAKHAKHRDFDENFTLNLSGNGSGDDNKTYSFTLQGDGRARERTSDGNVTKIEGAGLLRIVVTAANGTVIQDRDVPVTFKATDLADPDGGSWHIKSEAHKWFFWPKLHLHGSLNQSDDDSWSLEGKGHADFSKRGEMPKLHLKVSDLAGGIDLERA